MSDLINTSVDDIRSTLECDLSGGQRSYTVKALRNAIEAERRAGNRSSVISLLETQIRKRENLPTASVALVKSDPQEAVMARQLSEQYQKAVGGLWEVVKFGAMMLHVQATYSARGISGEGIKAWVAEKCPDVNLSNAYRFLHVAQGVKDEFKLGVKVDLLKLLDGTPTELAPADLKRRVAIEEFLQGKSQRQLLLSFGNPDPKPRGGDTGGRRALAPGEKDEIERADMTNFWTKHLAEIRFMGINRKSYNLIPKALRKSLLDAQIEFNHLLRESLS